MEKEALAKMIGIMFMSRTYTHMAHLKTSSYAAHKALNGFYDGIVGKADGLAEAVQGKYGKLDIPFVELKGSIDSPIDGIESQMMMIDNLCKKCEEDWIDNIVQDIQAFYRSTLYLLKELH
jgi:hypothetical protein